jgi:hypothetical protein
MKTTQNQIDFGIMGYEGRKYLLKDTARALELDADKTVPELAPQPPPDGAGGIPPNPAAPAPGQPKTLGPGGEAVAGQDFQLFNQRGGIPNG